MINLVGWFGSTKSQSQMNTANPDVRNKNPTLSASLPWKKKSPCFQVQIISFFLRDYIFKKKKKLLFTYMKKKTILEYATMCASKRVRMISDQLFVTLYVMHYLSIPLYTDRWSDIIWTLFEAHIVASSMK